MSTEAGTLWRPREEQIYCEDGSYTYDYVKKLIDSQIEIVPRENAINIAAWRGRQRIVPRLPSQPNWLTFLAKFETRVESLLKEHDNSDAKYVIDYHRFLAPDGKECMMYLWGMEPDQQTSKRPHVHGYGVDGKGIFEHHVILAGSAEVNGHLISAHAGFNNYHKASPGETHAAKTPKHEGGNMVVILEHIGGIPDHMIHRYLDTPIK